MTKALAQFRVLGNARPSNASRSIDALLAVILQSCDEVHQDVVLTTLGTALVRVARLVAPDEATAQMLARSALCAGSEYDLVDKAEIAEMQRGER